MFTLRIGYTHLLLVRRQKQLGFVLYDTDTFSLLRFVEDVTFELIKLSLPRNNCKRND